MSPTKRKRYDEYGRLILGPPPKKAKPKKRRLEYRVLSNSAVERGRGEFTIMTLEEWRGKVERRELTDYDGYGYCAYAGPMFRGRPMCYFESNMYAVPSKRGEVREKKAPGWVSHVIWYSRRKEETNG